jgi:hypothetical protein
MSNALDRLAAHGMSRRAALRSHILHAATSGEAFMAMFEDDEVDATLEASSKKRQKVGETAFVPVGPRQQEPSAARNPGSREEPLKPASTPQGRALQGRPQSARAPKPDLPRIERQLEQSIAANEAQRQLLDKKRLLEMKAFMSSKVRSVAGNRWSAPSATARPACSQASDVIQASVIGSKPFAPPNRKSPAKYGLRSSCCEKSPRGSRLGCVGNHCVACRTPESDEAAFALIARDVEFLGTCIAAAWMPG